jgi:hypothetical protein
MPYDDPDPTDPNVLVGVSLPADEEATREMAFAFAEEFAAIGFDEQRLMTLFRHSHYAGAHRAYRLLGEGEIRRIIQESLKVWGNYRVVVQDNEVRSGADELVQISSPEAARQGRRPGGIGTMSRGAQGNPAVFSPERGARAASEAKSRASTKDEE